MHPRRTRCIPASTADSPWLRAICVAELAVFAAAVLALSATASATGGENAQPPARGQEIGDQKAGDRQGSRLRVTSESSSGRKIRVLEDGESGESGEAGEARDSVESSESGEATESGRRRGRASDSSHVQIHIGRGIETDVDDKVAFGHDIHVTDGDVIPGNVVCVLGSARIEGTVRGDVVVIGGNVEVGPTGLVRGEAIAIGGGAVRVAGGGIVEGEAVAVGGRVQLTDDALVGERVEISFIPSFGPRFGISGLLWLVFLLHLFIMGLIGWVLLTVSRARCGVVVATLRARGWESLLAGVGGAILYHIVVVPLLLLLAVVLVAMVIGIPLVPVILLLMLVFPVPGYLATAALLGLSASGATGRLQPTPGSDAVPPQTRTVEGLGRAYFLGHFFLSLPGLMGLLLALVVGGPGLVSKSFLLLSFAVINLAIALGWGAILLSRFGRRGPAVAA
jgi:hypothetical protein